MLAIKLALTMLCSSLYSHKLKYLFTLLSNQNGYLDENSFILFSRYINDISKYFEKEENSIKMKIFDFTSLIDLNIFIENLTNFDKQNDSNSWIVVYHRLFDADSVTHNISCDSCEKNSFIGFRYKCKVCSNYNQCQECFWTGKKSKNHDPDSHPCKEYLFDNIKNQLGRSFRRSFRNSFRWRNKQKEQIKTISDNDDELITKRLNLSNIVSPRISRKNKSFPRCNFKFSDFCFEYPELSNNFNSDCEHKLIGHYLDILKKDFNQTRISSNLYVENVSINESYQKQICDLENKNCELMKRILEINSTQGNSFHFDNFSIDNSNKNNAFFAELSSLRNKKAALEQHLNHLHNRREKLMFQLDYLIKKFKNSNIK